MSHLDVSGSRLEYILSKLKKVRKERSGGYKALCPAHNDRNPSLSIGETVEGKILINCFADCSIEQIVKAMGITLRDLMPEKSNRKFSKQAKHEEATYDYTDENDKLLYQVVRYVNKDFRQRRPDVNGGWTWNLNGTRRVLYRLREVINSKEVMVVEGEKDAETLRDAGFIATTNPEGAGKWKKEYSEFLKGKEVIIIPDNDKAGIEHAHKVAKSIFKVAKTVKIIYLHQWLSEKGDVSDFLAFKTSQELRELINSTPGLRVEDMKELVSTPDRPEVDLQGWLAGEVEYEQKDIIGHVLALTEIEYEGVRNDVASKLNFRLSKLDEWYDRPNHDSATQTMLSPWPKEVVLWEIADEILTLLRRYVIIGEEHAIAVTLWTCASWIYNSFDIFPYLLLSSPTKRCGKTRLLGILRNLVNNGLQAASISAAALFRVVEAERPTLLLDEFDQQTNTDDLLNLLNSGHERSGASIRLVPQGKEYVHRSFSTFCPKIIAMIGKPKETLIDRSIVINMQRKKPRDTIERLDSNVMQILEKLQRKLARWRDDLEDRLPEVKPFSTNNNDREADNWIPLLVVAEIAAGQWQERARHAAKALSKYVEDDSVKIQLLQDIKSVFEKQAIDKITTSDLLKGLKFFEESPWGDWSHGNGLNARHLAGLLKPFGIEPKVIRIGDKTPRGYEYQDFQDTFEAYLPSMPIDKTQQVQQP